MHKLLYYSEFKSLNDNDIRLEIYKDTDDSITATELLLSSESINVEYTSDSIFKSLKQSSCTVNVLTDKVLKDLYTGKLNEILLKVFINDELFWFGYETQNVYSSDFTDELNNLSVEFVDTIAQLNNIKYKYIDNNKAQIRSLYEIITFILNLIDSNKIINYIHVSKSFSVNGIFDLLNNLFLQEKNFFDENDDSQTCKEVIEDIIKFLGLSLIQYKNSYYLIDYEAIKNNNYEFYLYNRSDFSTDGIVTLNSDIRNLNEVGIFDSNASISLENVYNKINLVANVNKIESPIPELFDGLKNQNSDSNYYEYISGDTYTYLMSWFISTGWTPSIGIIDNTYTPITTINKNNMGTIGTGCFYQKNDSYRNTDGEPSSLNWTNYLTMVNKQIPMFADSRPKSTFIYVNKSEDIIYKDGYFIFNLKYKLSNNVLADDNAVNVTGVTYSDSKYSTGIKPTKFAVKLKIGDYYYNGDEWELYSNYINNLAYYSQTTSIVEIYGVPKYYKNNGYGNIEIDEKEYNKINLRDKFWLIHTNKNGDNIFNDWKELDNKVSWKMNLADSSDGVAIKLPVNQILQGKLEFELSCPDTLGVEQCYQSNLTENATLANCCHIKDLSLNYTNSKYKTDLFDNKNVDTDTQYINVINDDFITELDDIELKVNTYTDKCASYSNLIIKNSNKYDYLNKVHNVIENVDVIQEQNIINKYYNYYSTPKFIYSNTINNKNISPLSVINVNQVADKMLINSLNYDLNNDSVTVNLTQF